MNQDNFSGCSFVIKGAIGAFITTGDIQIFDTIVSMINLRAV